MLFLKRIPLAFWFAVPTLILIIGGVWFFTKDSSSTMSEGTELSIEKVSKQVEGTVEYKIESRSHVPAGTSVSNYNSNPPNSGDHWDQPANNGVYENEQPDEQLVHNLEHGYIWISYLPKLEQSDATESAQIAQGLSDEDRKALEDLVKKDDWKIILAPRKTNDSLIALSAWGRVLKLDSLDLDKIREFIRVYRNRGPEKTPN